MSEVVPAKKRGFLRFQSPGKRPTLSREEFLYWSDLLSKVLKIGTEFEFNTPSSQEALKQVNDLAGCSRAGKDCPASDCSNLEQCLVDRHPSMCQTRASGMFLGQKFSCPAKSPNDTKSCKTCPAWMLNCRGMGSCAMFSPHCQVCPSFTRDGKMLPENSSIQNDSETIRNEMSRLLKPTGSVGKVGDHGVLEVKKDNSLLDNGGMEIPTVGRRVHWASFYRMSKEIIDASLARGAYVNERSGQHYHILAGYFEGGGRSEAISELERPMPEIILANLHQLHRRYELAMFWITSAGDTYQHLTRWARFRQSIYKYSSLHYRMLQIQAQIASEIICMNGHPKDGKYASVAYHFCKFNEVGDVRTFHIENRIADGLMSPAVVTAFAALWYAFVLKAVRLSQYGIMEVGDKDYSDIVAAVKPHVIDGEKKEFGNDRKANTAGIAPHISWLKANAKEMVDLMKPELHGLGPAYQILLDLADAPCSVRRARGDDWDKIESDLMAPHQQISSGLDGDIQEIVELAGMVDCQSVEEWVQEVAANLGADPAQVADITHRMLQQGRYRWSNPIGAVITA